MRRIDGIENIEEVWYKICQSSGLQYSVGKSIGDGAMNDVANIMEIKSISPR